MSFSSLTFEYVLNPVCCADEALSDYKKVLELDPTQLEANRAVRRLPQKVMFIYVIIYYALRIHMYPYSTGSVVFKHP